mmetsp:Transcript_37644/g.88035  ORF Transcript_37644/g.88035 Transcript_37644/m.88035 type:complete len:200 (-) Transcript_37644:149-748(-)
MVASSPPTLTSRRTRSGPPSGRTHALASTAAERRVNSSGDPVEARGGVFATVEYFLNASRDSARRRRNERSPRWWKPASVLSSDLGILPLPAQWTCTSRARSGKRYEKLGSSVGETASTVPVSTRTPRSIASPSPPPSGTSPSASRARAAEDRRFGGGGDEAGCGGSLNVGGSDDEDVGDGGGWEGAPTFPRIERRLHS